MKRIGWMVCAAVLAAAEAIGLDAPGYAPLNGTTGLLSDLFLAPLDIWRDGPLGRLRAEALRARQRGATGRFEALRTGAVTAAWYAWASWAQRGMRRRWRRVKWNPTKKNVFVCVNCHRFSPDFRVFQQQPSNGFKTRKGRFS